MVHRDLPPKNTGEKSSNRFRGEKEGCQKSSKKKYRFHVTANHWIMGVVKTTLPETNSLPLKIGRAPSRKVIFFNH